MSILIKRLSALEYVTKPVAERKGLNKNIVQVHIRAPHAREFRWHLILERL